MAEKVYPLSFTAEEIDKKLQNTSHFLVTKDTIIDASGEIVTETVDNITLSVGKLPYFNIREGDIYSVVYNGEAYSCLGTKAGLGNIGVLFEMLLGILEEGEEVDSSIIALIAVLSILVGADPTVPFYIMINDEEQTCTIMTNDKASTFDVEISKTYVDIEPNIVKYLQPDFNQYNTNKPATIKNKPFGINSTGVIFYNGLVDDLTINSTPIGEDETLYYTKIGSISYLTLLGMLVGSEVTGNVSILENALPAIIASVNDRYSTYLLPDELIEGTLSNEDMTILEEILGENSEAVPFGNLSILDDSLPNSGGNFCFVLQLNKAEEAIESTIDLYGATRKVLEVGTTITAELGMETVLKKRSLPAISTKDLPNETVTDFKTQEFMVLKDEETKYEYLVGVKAGQLTLYIRCEKIEITTPPNKTSYVSGDTFDTTGMVVTATFQDGTTKEITDYTVYPTSIASSTEQVTIRYYEAGKTYTAPVAITVAS